MKKVQVLKSCIDCYIDFTCSWLWEESLGKMFSVQKAKSWESTGEVPGAVP